VCGVSQPDPDSWGVSRRVEHPDGGVDLYLEVGVASAHVALAVARYVGSGLTLLSAASSQGRVKLSFRGPAAVVPVLPPTGHLSAGALACRPVRHALSRGRPGRR
jgi:hypothetical protein